MLQPRVLSTFPIRCLQQGYLSRCTRCFRPQISFLHTNNIRDENKPRIPPTSSDIPDVKTFLERIGRDVAKECEDKIKTWKQLFSADGQALKAKEIPPRLRRYILLQTEKYRNGEKIAQIRRGKKVGGGERRRNKGPSKAKIGS